MLRRLFILVAVLSGCMAPIAAPPPAPHAVDFRPPETGQVGIGAGITAGCVAGQCGLDSVFSGDFDGTLHVGLPKQLDILLRGAHRFDGPNFGLELGYSPIITDLGRFRVTAGFAGAWQAEKLANPDQKNGYRSLSMAHAVGASWTFTPTSHLTIPLAGRASIAHHHPFVRETIHRSEDVILHYTFNPYTSWWAELSSGIAWKIGPVHLGIDAGFNISPELGGSRAKIGTGFRTGLAIRVDIGRSSDEE